MFPAQTPTSGQAQIGQTQAYIPGPGPQNPVHPTQAFIPNQNPYQGQPGVHNPPPNYSQYPRPGYGPYGQPGMIPGGIYKPGQSVVLAVILSFFLTGIGQMYNGQVGKGFVLLFGTLFFLCGFAPIGLGLWVVGLVDAAQIAGKLNQGRVVGQWEFF